MLSEPLPEDPEPPAEPPSPDPPEPPAGLSEPEEVLPLSAGAASLWDAAPELLPLLPESLPDAEELSPDAAELLSVASELPPDTAVLLSAAAALPVWLSLTEAPVLLLLDDVLFAGALPAYDLPA